VAYRYDISYPFFDLAQRYDVDYGHVLAFEDFLENYAGKLPWLPEHKAASAALSEDAKQELYRLSKLPVHQRGGRTDICDKCGAVARGGQRAACRRGMPGVAGHGDCLLEETVH
jgi:hypothetical protein